MLQMPRWILPFVLSLFSFPSFAAEVAISDVRALPGPSHSIRFSPSVVSGDGFLVLWEQRYGPGYPEAAAVRAYDAHGVPRGLGATNLVVSVYSPRAVWTGTDYMIVAGPTFGRWGASTIPYPSIVVERVRPDGTRIDVPPQQHLPATRPSSVLSLAWNGTHALAVVAGGDSQRHLLLLDGEGQLVSDTVTGEDIVAAAPNGADFFLLRRDQGTAIAAGGDRFAVVNGDAIAILDRAGMLLESFAIGRGMKSVAYDGTRWVTAHLDAAGVCTATFTSASDVQRSCRSTTEVPASPSAAGSGREVLTAWEEPATTQIMTDSGLASTFIAAQRVNDTAVDASGLLVVWQEGQRLVAGGLHSDGTRREQHMLTESGFNARVASLGDRSLVVWSSGVVQAIVLDGDGSPLLPVAELGFGQSPRVAANSEGWVVVQDAGSRVTATYVTRDGIVGGVHDFGRDDAHVPQYGPDIAAVSDGYVVVWMQLGSEGLDVISQKLTRFGLPVGPQIVLGNAGTAYASGYDASFIGCAGDRCLVVWRRDLVTYVGRYVDRSGAPIAVEETFPSGEPGRQLPSVVISPVGGQLRIFRTDEGIGGVETVNGRTLLVFSRATQIFARDLLPRIRAARH